MTGLQPASHTIYTAYGRTLNYHFILSGNVNPFSCASFSPRASAMLTASLTSYAEPFRTSGAGHAKLPYQ